MIENPVLSGFHPDPSVIRVGNMYYAATSTFEWFPGVRLHESLDLEHWEPLPFPLDRISQLDMRGVASGCGVWAPDLSYADGKFWLVYSNTVSSRGTFKDVRNYVVTSTDIHGPWSEPIPLNGVGFDPSLFHDSDGRKYLLQQTIDSREYHHRFNGITITELDANTMQLKRETQRILWQGSPVQVTEGPHLYRKNDWYYLFAAEGGTGRSHQETVARARNLLGPYEVMDEPLLTNYDDPYGPLQCQGHGSLFDTPDGEWYYASLCRRPWRHETEPLCAAGWSTLGRETSIHRVIWENEWPRIVGGRHGSLAVEEPDAVVSTDDNGLPLRDEDTKRTQHDDFMSESLGIDWQTLRVPFDERMGHVGGGQLLLRGEHSLCSTFNVSMVARRWQSFDFTAETSLAFRPITYQAMAGLINYYGATNWSGVVVTYDERRCCRVLEVLQCAHGRLTSYLQDQAIAIPDDCSSVQLRVEVHTQTYRYAYSFSDDVTEKRTGLTPWVALPVVLDAAVLSDEYSEAGGDAAFTGAFVGLAAMDYSGYGEEASFSYFNYCEQ